MKTITQLLSHSSLNRLEAEILLAHALKVPRSFLYTHADDVIDETIFLALSQRRLQGEPIAYIVGEKEFWESIFIVNPRVLIPRPETELLVEKVLSLFPKEQKIKLADLGAGSGAIALSLAQERPNWDVVATDVSEDALKIAKQNQVNLHIQNVRLYQGSWCEALPNELFDIIVSNPPYIAENDVHLQQGDLRFEPRSALMAKEDGLADIKNIVKHAKQYLKPSGFLLMEHGYDQAQVVANIFANNGYYDIQCLQDLAGLDRATVGRRGSRE